MQESQDALREELERCIAAASGEPCAVSRLAMLAGGASQEAWAVDLELAGGARHALVLRRDIGGALSSAVLPREHEFAALRAMYAAGLPVPRPYWFLPDLRGGADGPPRAAFLMQRLEGETIGRRIVTSPALEAVRAPLLRQAAAVLARLHALPPSSLALPFLDGPPEGQSAATRQLQRLEADLDRVGEPHPAIELGLRWLSTHAPIAREERLVVVHGDFRVGNFVVGAEGLRGVLDWENIHLGDAYDDLAWLCVRAWRFGRDDLPAGGLGARADLYAAYEAAGGQRVDRERVFYWEVLGNARWALGALGQAQRHLSGAARSVELAALGRICAEMELELLDLIEGWEAGTAWPLTTKGQVRHAG